MASTEHYNIVCVYHDITTTTHRTLDVLYPFVLILFGALYFISFDFRFFLPFDMYRFKLQHFVVWSVYDFTAHT